MIQTCKIPLSKTISNGFCIVTVKVLNSYEKLFALHNNKERETLRLIQYKLSRPGIDATK